jgi:4'-phosphopantetheinyl transferase
VEAIQRDVEALEIATANFTSNETAMVAATVTPREQARIFLRLWTRKEAVLKAAGCGLIDGLKEFDVAHEPLDRVRLCGATDDCAESYWRVQDLETIDGFAGAVAAPVGDWSIHQYCVGCDEAIRSIAGECAGSQ